MADRRFLLAMQQLREDVASHATAHHEPAFLEGLRAWLGDRTPRDHDEVLAALAFSVVSTADDGTVLFERFAEAADRLPRIRRRVLATWAAARFVVASVSEVELDRGLHVHDVLTGRDHFVFERAATHEILAGEWLAALLIDVGGHDEFEGAAIILPRGARHAAVTAFLQALDGADPSTASAEATRGAMRAVARTRHAAPDEPIAAAAGWSDAVHPALEATPRAALAAGRRAEVLALVSDLDTQGERDAREQLAL